MHAATATRKNKVWTSEASLLTRPLPLKGPHASASTMAQPSDPRSANRSYTMVTMAATLAFLGAAAILYTMRVPSVLSWVATGGLLHKTFAHDYSDCNEELRLNHIQVVGTHNSYHREISRSERDIFEKYIPDPENVYYSHSKWTDQLDHQSVRSFEIDLHSDTEGGLYSFPLIWKLSNLTEETAPFNNSIMKRPGLKVFHITDVDTNAICHTFVQCLEQLKAWSESNPGHLPLTFDIELKSDALACGLGGVCAQEAKQWTLERILNVDAEIRSVLSSDKLIVPDDVRRPGLTLEQSVLKHGWPSLEDSRNKFMFYFDNDPDSPDKIRDTYRSKGSESLQNRTVFTNAVEGDADAAFIKFNHPNVTEIQRLVKKGYFIRTRADEPITTLLTKDTTMRDNAFKSAAHVVSTDFPAYGMSARYDSDYAVQFKGGRVGRCNPVSAPDWCKDRMVQ